MKRMRIVPEEYRPMVKARHCIEDMVNEELSKTKFKPKYKALVGIMATKAKRELRNEMGEKLANLPKHEKVIIVAKRTIKLLSKNDGLVHIREWKK